MAMRATGWGRAKVTLAGAVVKMPWRFATPRATIVLWPIRVFLRRKGALSSKPERNHGKR